MARLRKEGNVYVPADVPQYTTDNIKEMRRTLVQQIAKEQSILNEMNLAVSQQKDKVEDLNELLAEYAEIIEAEAPARAVK